MGSYPILPVVFLLAFLACVLLEILLWNEADGLVKYFLMVVGAAMLEMGAASVFCPELLWVGVMSLGIKVWGTVLAFRDEYDFEKFPPQRWS